LEYQSSQQADAKFVLVEAAPLTAHRSRFLSRF
jgi:hypothetical protein